MVTALDNNIHFRCLCLGVLVPFFGAHFYVLQTDSDHALSKSKLVPLNHQNQSDRRIFQNPTLDTSKVLRTSFSWFLKLCKSNLVELKEENYLASQVFFFLFLVSSLSFFLLFFLSFLFFSVMEIKSKASHRLGKPRTTELHPQPSKFLQQCFLKVSHCYPKNHAARFISTIPQKILSGH